MPRWLPPFGIEALAIIPGFIWFILKTFAVMFFYVWARATFPRYKACGGGIPLRTERLLSFPIDSVVEDSVHLLDVARFGKDRFLKDSGKPFAHMVMRDRFDALLKTFTDHIQHKPVGGEQAQQAV